MTSVPMRWDSAIDVPGTAAICSVKWPSFSSGRNPAPKNGTAEQPTSVKRNAAANVVRGCATIFVSMVS